MLSRLLEAGPTQFSPPLGFMVSADSASNVPFSAATPVPADSTLSTSTGLSAFHLHNSLAKSPHIVYALHHTQFLEIMLLFFFIQFIINNINLKIVLYLPIVQKSAYY